MSIHMEYSVRWKAFSIPVTIDLGNPALRKCIQGVYNYIFYMLHVPDDYPHLSGYFSRKTKQRQFITISTLGHAYIGQPLLYFAGLDTNNRRPSPFVGIGMGEYVVLLRQRLIVSIA